MLSVWSLVGGSDSLAMLFISNDGGSSTITVDMLQLLIEIVPGFLQAIVFICLLDHERL